MFLVAILQSVKEKKITSSGFQVRNSTLLAAPVCALMVMVAQ